MDATNLDQALAQTAVATHTPHRIAGIVGASTVTVVMFSENLPVCQDSTLGSSPLVITLPEPGPPEAPTIVDVTDVQGGSFSVTWIAPDDTGGAVITMFTLRAASVGPGGVVGATGVHTVDVQPTASFPSRQSHTLYGLQANTAYHIELVAFNPHGFANASHPTAVTTTGLNPPGPPTALVATAVSGGAVVATWEAPLDAGGVSHGDLAYNVVMEDVTQSAQANVCDGEAARSCAVYGLRALSRYRFSVQASNPSSTGSHSSLVSVDMPTATPPSQPPAPALALIAGCGSGLFSPRCSVGADSLIIAPAGQGLPVDAGGAEIDDVVLQRFNGTSQAWVTLGHVDADADVDVATLVLQVNGLQAGQELILRTFAVSASGLASEPSSAVTVATSLASTRPDAPLVPSGFFSESGGSVCVTWTAPDATGGSPIVKFNVYDATSPQGGNCAVGGCPLVGEAAGSDARLCVYGLTAQRTYSYMVLAVNAVLLEGPASAVVPAVTAAATPATAPRQLRVSNAESTSVDFTWTAPLDLGGNAGLAYDYVVSQAGVPTPVDITGSVVATQVSHTVSGLAPGTAFTVKVRLVTGAGLVGEWSPEISFTTAELDAQGCVGVCLAALHSAFARLTLRHCYTCVAWPM